MIEIGMGVRPDVPVARFRTPLQRFHVQEARANLPVLLTIKKEYRNCGMLHCSILG
jgi:hypothetical protein